MRAATLSAITLAVALSAPLPGCSGSEREIVVTREEFGEIWPLRINSAVVICSAEGGTLLKLGAKRYALDEVALAEGYEDARGIDAARHDGVMELRSVCTAVAADE